MKKVALVMLLLMAIFLMPACNKTVQTSVNPTTVFYQYMNEVIQAQKLATQRSMQSQAQLQAGNITSEKYRLREYQTTFIEAYTLEYIDSKTEYEPLLPVIFDGNPPHKLPWCIPELESNPAEVQASFESYLSDWIGAHYWAVDEYAPLMPSEN